MLEEKGAKQRANAETRTHKSARCSDFLNPKPKPWPVYELGTDFPEFLKSTSGSEFWLVYVLGTDFSEFLLDVSLYPLGRSGLV